MTGAKDAFQMVEKDICKFFFHFITFQNFHDIFSYTATLSDGIKELLGSDHPVLESCAKYFFDSDGGKKIRPTMVLAISYALNGQATENPQQWGTLQASPSQKRVAEITEMIHTASLFHDDVIDKATTRRNMNSVNQVKSLLLALISSNS
jgi:geranylgeranyl pyrophosphate synthase